MMTACAQLSCVYCDETTGYARVICQLGLIGASVLATKPESCDYLPTELLVTCPLCISGGRISTFSVPAYPE